MMMFGLSVRTISTQAPQGNQPEDNHLLHLIHQHVNVLRLLQIGLQDRWWSSSREALPDDETASILERVEDLAAQQAAGSSDQNSRRHDSYAFDLVCLLCRLWDGRDNALLSSGALLT